MEKCQLRKLNKSSKIEQNVAHTGVYCVLRVKLQYFKKNQFKQEVAVARYAFLILNNKFSVRVSDTRCFFSLFSLLFLHFHFSVCVTKVANCLDRSFHAACLSVPLCWIA